MTAEVKEKSVFEPNFQDRVARITILAFKYWKGDPVSDNYIDALNLALELAHISNASFSLVYRSSEGEKIASISGNVEGSSTTAEASLGKLSLFDGSSEELIEFAPEDIEYMVYMPQNPGTYR